mgnify:CR=1 FL=1
MGIVFCVTTQTETQKHRICHVVWQDASHPEGHWVDLNDTQQTTTYISGEMIIPVAMILQLTHLDSAKENR